MEPAVLRRFPSRAEPLHPRRTRADLPLLRACAHRRPPGTTATRRHTLPPPPAAPAALSLPHLGAEHRAPSLLRRKPRRRLRLPSSASRAHFGSPLCRPVAGPRPGPRGTRHGLPRLPRAPPPAPRAVPFPSAAPAAPWAAVTRQSVTGANDRLITGLPGQRASPAAFGYRHGMTAPAKPAQRSHRDLHPAAAAAVPGRGIAPGVGFTSRLLQRRG